MKTNRCSSPAGAAALKFRAVAIHLLLAVPALLVAESPVTPPLLEIASGLPGKQVRLSWPAVVGQRYRVERSTTLASGNGGGWEQLATVDATGTQCVWLDCEPTVAKAFYRVTQPQAEVFAISPPLLSPTGGVLLLRGQAIPPGSLLVVESDGQAALEVPLEDLGGGVWRANVAAPFVPGGSVISARIVAASGTTLVTLNQPLTVTATGRAADSPPSLPPGAPEPLALSNPIPGIGIVVKHNPRPSGKRVAAGDGEDDDCDGTDDACPESLLAAFLTKKGYDYYQAQSQLNSAGLTNAAAQKGL